MLIQVNIFILRVDGFIETYLWLRYINKQPPLKILLETCDNVLHKTCE